MLSGEQAGVLKHLKEEIPVGAAPGSRAEPTA